MADNGEVRIRSRSPSPPPNGGGLVGHPDRSPARLGSPALQRSRSPPRRSPTRRSRSKSPARARSRSPRRKSSRSPSRRSRRSRSPPRAVEKKTSRSKSPEPCKVLGVFGLHPNTTARDIKDVFIKYGDIDHVDLITDHQTGRSKCFGFVYYKSVHDAAKAKEGLAGLIMDGKTLRIDFSYTRKAHSPTPGKYLGKAARRRIGGGGDRDRYSRRDDYDRYENRYDRYDRYDRDRYDRDRYDRERYDRDRYDRDRYERRSPY